MIAISATARIHCSFQTFFVYDLKKPLSRIFGVFMHNIERHWCTISFQYLSSQLSFDHTNAPLHTRKQEVAVQKLLH